MFWTMFHDITSFRCTRALVARTRLILPVRIPPVRRATVIVGIHHHHEIHVSGVQKPWLVDDSRGLYYPICWDL